MDPFPLPQMGSYSFLTLPITDVASSLHFPTLVLIPVGSSGSSCSQHSQCHIYLSHHSSISRSIFTWNSNLIRKRPSWRLHGGPVTKNPPSNSGGMGSIPGWGTKIPHAMGQLSPRTTTTENLGPSTRKKPEGCNERSHMLQQRSHMPQLRPDAAKNKQTNKYILF